MPPPEAQPAAPPAATKNMSRSVMASPTAKGTAAGAASLPRVAAAPLEASSLLVMEPSIVAAAAAAAGTSMQYHLPSSAPSLAVKAGAAASGAASARATTSKFTEVFSESRAPRDGRVSSLIGWRDVSEAGRSADAGRRVGAEAGGEEPRPEKEARADGSVEEMVMGKGAVEAGWGEEVAAIDALGPAAGKGEGIEGWGMGELMLAELEYESLCRRYEEWKKAVGARVTEESADRASLLIGAVGREEVAEMTAALAEKLERQVRDMKWYVMCELRLMQLFGLEKRYWYYREVHEAFPVSLRETCDDHGGKMGEEKRREEQNVGAKAETVEVEQKKSRPKKKKKAKVDAKESQPEKANPDPKKETAAAEERKSGPGQMKCKPKKENADPKKAASEQMKETIVAEGMNPGPKLESQKKETLADMEKSELRSARSKPKPKTKTKEDMRVKDAKGEANRTGEIKETTMKEALSESIKAQKLFAGLKSGIARLDAMQSGLSEFNEDLYKTTKFIKVKNKSNNDTPLKVPELPRHITYRGVPVPNQIPESIKQAIWDLEFAWLELMKEREEAMELRNKCRTILTTLLGRGADAWKSGKKKCTETTSMLQYEYKRTSVISGCMNVRYLERKIERHFNGETGQAKDSPALANALYFGRSKAGNDTLWAHRLEEIAVNFAPMEANVARIDDMVSETGADLKIPEASKEWWKYFTDQSSS